MKPRTVVLTIEVETAEPLAQIRKATQVYLGDDASGMKLAADVVQIQANVIKPKAKGKR